MLTKRDLLRNAGAAAVATSTTAGLARAQSGRLGFFRARDIAEAGFIYGLPIVMNYAVMNQYVINRKSGQWKAPFNAIFNEARVYTYKDTAIPTPNSDTPYSLLWADMRAEPLVVSVPAVDPNRYYSIQLCDGNTYNYGYIGSRATGSDAGDYLITGPQWKGDAPAGIKKVFRSGTQFSLMIFRTQLFSPDDIGNVKKVQAGYQVRPLSAFLNQPPPPAASSVQFPAINNELVKKNFFEYLDFALQFAPPQPNEQEIRAQLASIGIGPGKTFNFKDLPLKDKLEIGLSMKEGDRKVDEAVTKIGENVNAWNVGSAFGDATFYSGDWLLRAAGARAGIYGNSAEEATYPLTRADGGGQALDGSKYNYTLTFPKDGLPPVNAFWSVTMYDGKTQLLIKNPIDRYLVNSPMLPSLKRNADGSLTIYIQNSSPGSDRQSNWLPAPHGPIYLVMRLYWPKTEAPSILPPGKGSWQPPGIVRVS